ncbi:(2Fe-2S) ferredoxin domain-containing protein [Methylobacterium nigriterrae]|uniref:(2Fe-2S) ferredoxin domain-containing protein n=1 Tax=Methylobacterium nigriterrae TaxID=3127512 RepID=UPI003013F7C5
MTHPTHPGADDAARTARAAEPGRVRTTKSKTAKSRIAEVVLVCAKCRKRQGLGRRDLRGRLKGALKRGRPKREVRIVETGCLGPCPKRALAVATGASLAARKILLLDPAATPEEALAAILPDFGPKAALAPGAGPAEGPESRP